MILWDSFHTKNLEVKQEPVDSDDKWFEVKQEPQNVASGSESEDETFVFQDALIDNPTLAESGKVAWIGGESLFFVVAPHTQFNIAPPQLV